MLSSDLQSRASRHPAASRAILHVDMDAFYASVEQRDNPALRGQPVIVGGTANRGVVAAASYEVRTFGVHSAMPTREALRRCPHAICVPPRFEHYKAISAHVFGIFHRYTPLVQGLSLDEAFLDVTSSLSIFGSAEAIGARIKQEIHSELALTASVGVASNKLVAKIASDLRKPDGLVVVSDDQIEATLDPLPAKRLFGIGARTAEALAKIGVHTLRDLRLCDEHLLRPVLGRFAHQAKARAAGIDDRPVIPDAPEKQISAEETFDTDIGDVQRLRAELATLADRAAERMRKRQLVAGRVHVKIREASFRTFTRQCALKPPTAENHALATAAEKLLLQWLAEHPGTKLRLLGVGGGDLSTAPQLDLFAADSSSRNENLDAALDRIRDKFGRAAVTRGAVLGHEREEKAPTRR